MSAAEDTERMSNAERLLAMLQPLFPDGETLIDEPFVDRMVAALEDLTTDDLVTVMSGAENFEATYEGLDGAREAWSEWLDAFAEVRFAFEQAQDVGENVIVFVRQIGTTRHGEVEIEQPSAAVWKFRDGRVARIEFHLDRELARKSAQISADPSS
jgi:ketosteroid isomerase-like protein